MDVQLTLDAATGLSVSKESRTIRGRAVPFGVVGSKGYMRLRFAKGSLKVPENRRVKVLVEHEARAAVGYVSEFSESDDGADVVMKLGRGPRADEALMLAEDGVLDGLSVGVNITDYESAAVDDDYVYDVTSAEWLEVSLTALPVFATAQVTAVAASLRQEGTTMPEDKPTPTPAPPADVQLSEDAVRGIVNDAVSTAVQAEFAARPPAPSAPAAEVREPAPYRFDGVAGPHEFSTDLFAGMRGSSEAKARIDKFIADTFAVAKADVDDVNPAGYRPDLYVDYIEKAAPVMAAFNAGTVSSVTPFIVPKFASAGGLVADHVEGTDPDSGTFVTTSQTVTPAPVSGLVQIRREVIDQGGNPNVSQLVWRQMNRAYAELLETKAAAVLNAAALTELGVVAADADGVEAALIEAVFVDGSEEWDVFLAHRAMFKAVAAAEDADGRKLYPIQAPSNASGTTATKFRSIDIGGYRAVPAGTLGTETTAAKSYIGASDAAPMWSSAPQSINWETVANKNVGLFGYFAGAVVDASRLRKLTFTPGV